MARENITEDTLSKTKNIPEITPRQRLSKDGNVILKRRPGRIARVKFSKRCRPAERRDEMAYSDVQQTEFNRATENLIEITWTYVNLQKEFPKLSETDRMGRNQEVYLHRPAHRRNNAEPL